MAKQGVDELAIHLEQSMDISAMEHGVKLVGSALTSKALNKWGVRNILKAAWKEYGEIEIKWVKENTFIITVPDESVAAKLLNQVPWGVMKKNFSVKLWPPELALEEVELEHVPFWVQIRGVPLCLISSENVKRLTKQVGVFMQLEDPAKARGFLRVRILINADKPLISGCWLNRENNRDTWVEFRYERLQDFCYRCGRLNHVNLECSFEAHKGGEAGFGEWTKALPIRDVVEATRPLSVGAGIRRRAGAVREDSSSSSYSKSQASDSAGNQPHGMKARRVDQRDDIGSFPRDRKKWHRKTRHQGTSGHLNWSAPLSINQSVWGSGSSCYPFFQNIIMQQSGKDRNSVTIHDITKVVPNLPNADDEASDCIQSECSLLSLHTHPSLEGTRQKRGKEPQIMEIFQSPQKKVRIDESRGCSNTRMAEKVKAMSIKDRSLIIESVINAKETLQEIPLEFYEIWEYLMETSKDGRGELNGEPAGNGARGGGGWPSTAARPI
ncbi:hypothetical protein ACFXTH_001361 [Malus domestica]